MDDRVREHAELLVDWSARVEAGDRVVVGVDDGTHELAVAVARELGERGAVPTFLDDGDELERAYCRGATTFAEPDHERALFETADVYLGLRGGRNTAALADVPGEKRQARGEASATLREARLATDWVTTVHPTRSLAQAAGMSIEAYREFVYDATLRDWAALEAETDRLKRLLDEGSRLRVVAPDTDLELSIEDRTAVNSVASVAHDSHNLPSGEVFTAPADVEGQVHFSVPRTVGGRRVEELTLVFEDGEVVDFSAVRGEDAVAELLDTDAGARRAGEVGVGTNRGIDRFTDNVTFDEKVAGTVHVALGRAYDANLPEGESGNDSQVHVDLIADLRDGGRLEVDGELVQRDGLFRWEEGFEE
jgi:aminopeptidase